MKSELDTNFKIFRDGMRIGIARQECRLEEDHAGIPDGWRPTERRKNPLRDHRLYAEEQSGGDEERAGEEADPPAHAARDYWRLRTETDAWWSLNRSPRCDRRWHRLLFPGGCGEPHSRRVRYRNAEVYRPIGPGS